MMQKLIDAGIKVEQKVRGEDEVAVACASIVAKQAVMKNSAFWVECVLESDT